MNSYIKETLYLYKVLENIIDKLKIIDKDYKDLFLKKILTLSNEKIKKIINLLIEGENKIEKDLEISHYKILIEENRFMEKFVNINGI